MVSFSGELRTPTQVFGRSETKSDPILKFYIVKNIGINPNITIRSLNIVRLTAKKGKVDFLHFETSSEGFYLNNS